MNRQDRVAIVTGGANGIGLAACLEFAAAGNKVVLVDIDAQSAQAGCEALEARRLDAIWVQADVGQSDQVQRYVKAALDAFGRIDVLFNNAGIAGAQTRLVDYPDDVFERVMRVNVMGTFLGLKHVLPVMIAQGKGVVVNMASVAGTVGAPTMAAYSASKHAIIGLTRTAAGEVGKLGVRVNAVCPGPIDTALIDSLHAGINPQDPASVKAFNIERNPMGRYGDPAEVAKVVAFLASDAASYVNGVAWLIDGGRTAI
jgi:NAD(P)-dependent dehydrogenase (short-subunit alcohol dehydrogenase family)